MGNTIKTLLTALATQQQLPYYPVDHLRVTGGQWVNTGIIPTETTEMFVDFKSSVKETMFMAGSRIAYNDDMFSVANNWISVNEGYLFQISNLSRSSEASGIPTEATERQTMLLKVANSEMNGTSINYTYVNPQLPNLPIYLGALNQNGSIDPRTFKGNIYAFYIKQDGVTVANYIPCIDKVSGKVGFWDTISDEFKGSQSDIDFFAPITVPYGCIHQTNGTQAYYDLGEILNPETPIEIDIELKYTLPSGYFGLFGSRINYDKDDSYAFWLTRFDSGEVKTVLSTSTYIPGVPCTIRVADNRIYINGVEKSYNSGVPVDQTFNTFLFNVNTNGVPVSQSYLPEKTLLYAVRVYNKDNTIKHNYLPQVNQTRECSITGKVLPKLGTGSFDILTESGYYSSLQGAVDDLNISPSPSIEQNKQILNEMGIII